MTGVVRKEHPRSCVAWFSPELLPGSAPLPNFLEGAGSMPPGALANTMCASGQNTHLPPSPPTYLPRALRSLCPHLNAREGFLGPPMTMYYTPCVRVSHPFLNFSLGLPTRTFNHSSPGFFSSSLPCSVINHSKASTMLVFLIPCLISSTRCRA